MYKVFLTVRNRLEITKMCIQALIKHSSEKPHIYVYDNLTDYKIEEHFSLWYKLYEKGIIDQITFTTKNSTFGSFSKASTNNFFGLQHEQDPDKNKYDFLVILDNDIIVTPNWDSVLKQAWKDITTYGMNDIKVIGQLPGGIQQKKIVQHKIAGVMAEAGSLGGSGLWSVKNNFFSKVGLLDLKKLVGATKKHDQFYWYKLATLNLGKPYILGLDRKLGIHCGGLTFSLCKFLSKNKSEDIKGLEDKTDKYLQGVTFSEFYESIINDEELTKGW